MFTKQSLKHYLTSNSLQCSMDLVFEMYEILSGLSFGLLFIHPINFSIIFADTLAQKQLQYSFSELLSIPFYQLHESPWEKISRLFELSQNQKRKHFYSNLKKKDGTYFYAEIFFGLFFLNGESCCFVFIKNLSENIRKEEQLIQNVKRYQTLFSAINFPFACLEVSWGENKQLLSCNLTEFNQAFEAIVTVQSENLHNRPILEILPPFEQLPSPWIEYINKVMLDHESVTFEVNIGLHPKNFLVTAYPVNEKEFCIIFDDITSQKRLDKLRNAFINTLTHEIRAPLTAIKAGMEIWTKNMITLAIGARQLVVHDALETMASPL